MPFREGELVMPETNPDDNKPPQTVEEIDLTAPASREEVIALFQGLANDVQSVVDQFNQMFAKIIDNQKYLDDRITVLEDPAKPKIYLP